MYQRIRKGLKLIGKDIHALLPAIAALAVYWTVTHLLFDRFCPMQILLGLPCPGLRDDPGAGTGSDGTFGCGVENAAAGVRMDGGGSRVWCTALPGES